MQFLIKFIFFFISISKLFETYFYLIEENILNKINLTLFIYISIKFRGIFIFL